MTFPKWPSWRFGPGGQSAVFESEADVPVGWVDHPTKVKGAAPPAKAKPAKAKPAEKAESKPKAAPAAKRAGRPSKAAKAAAAAAKPLDL